MLKLVNHSARAQDFIVRNQLQHTSSQIQKPNTAAAGVQRRRHPDFESSIQNATTAIGSDRNAVSQQRCKLQLDV